MALALRFAARSDVGLLREGNEDSAYAGPRLLVVADGMGGHAAGEVASSVAVATLAALDEDTPGPDLLGRLSSAVELANAHLRDMVEGDPALGGMGTTLTALLRAGPRFGLVHVGDSRCYLLRSGELQQVTHDHTFVQTLVDEGRISPEEADHHPQRALLTNALDGRGSVDADLSIRETRAGDRWLLCSDGLSGVVSEQTLRDTLAEGDPDTAAEALVDLALRAGGPDNITCIVADVVEVDSSPSDIPQVVGAAASGPVRYRRDGGHRTARSSSAARAAALAPPPDRTTTALSTTARTEPEHPPARRRPLLVALASLVALVLLGAGGAAAYAWSREQYYVGAHERNVAIFRGLTQNVLGLSLSSLYEDRDIPLDALSDYSRRRVEATISAADLPDARRIVARLDEEAAACREQGTAPTPAPTAGGGAAVAASPGPTPVGGSSPATAGTAGPTPGPTDPTPGPTPGSTPSPTPTGATPAATGPAVPTPEIGTGDRACPEPTP